MRSSSFFLDVFVFLSQTSPVLAEPVSARAWPQRKRRKTASQNSGTERLDRKTGLLLFVSMAIGVFSEPSGHMTISGHLFPAKVGEVKSNLSSVVFYLSCYEHKLELDFQCQISSRKSVLF